MTRPVLLASVIGDGTISVSLGRLVEVGSAAAAGVRKLLRQLLPTIGMPQDLGDAGDEIHVLTHSPAAAITALMQLCAAHDIEVRDVTPVALDDAPTIPRHVDTEVVDDPDAASPTVDTMTIGEILQRLTARGYRYTVIEAVDYRFVIEVVRVDPEAP